MISRLFPIVLGRLSPGGSMGRLSILIFHRVLATRDPLFPETPDAADFERQMTWVSKAFNVLPLAEAVERHRRSELPARALAITFDDGYADNATVAVPLLRGLGLTATFFVTSGVLDGGRMWNDTVIECIRRAPRGRLDLISAGLGPFDLVDDASRREAIESIIDAIKRRGYNERRDIVDRIAQTVGVELPSNLMMTSNQVRELARQGMSVGGHTVTHPILTRLDEAEALDEIARGRDNLRQITGEAVDLFAYPNGVPGVDYDTRHVDMVRKCGFSAAVSTARGCAAAGADMYQLPRFTPWDRTELRYGLRLMSTLLAPRYEIA